jgi:hypothetical protein
MNHKLQKTLQSDLALATQEDHLIFHARKLYQMGFTPQHISPSQMAALVELIRTASNLEEAQQRAETWLLHQMDKLQAKAERAWWVTLAAATQDWYRWKHSGIR